MYSKAYIESAVQELKEEREPRQMGSRASNTAAATDARATVNAISLEVSSLAPVYSPNIRVD